jgi:mannose-6-phosphate isomerase class I
VAEEFALTREVLSRPEERLSRTATAPEILLVTSGSLSLECDSNSAQVGRGESFIVPAGETYLIRGEGELFRATVGRPE